jgi:hypothetical protein
VGDPSSPEMSVVIVTPDHYGTIGRAIGYLRAQTVRERLALGFTGEGIPALLGASGKDLPPELWASIFLDIGSVLQWASVCRHPCAALATTAAIALHRGGAAHPGGTLPARSAAVTQV